jgi:F-type H+-transporting ATPase subunit b
MELNFTLIGQLITFVILVAFIMKYVWPPITKALSEREKTIAAGLEASERGKRELIDAEHKAINIIREAKVEAASVIDQAQKRTIQIIDEAKEDARQEASRVLERAQADIVREVNQAKEGMRKQLATLAVAGAEKIIQRNLDLSAQTALLDEFVAEI